MRQLIYSFTMLVAASLSATAAQAAPVDFDREIKPLLEQHCTSCHGEQKTKGHLRLDVKSLALNGGTTGPLLTAGDATKSLLIHRLRGAGNEERMPLDKPPLAEDQIALIARWIDEGANWPETGPAVERKSHWAYVAPKRPTVPEVSNKQWPKNDIDRFILARLDKEGIEPSPSAPRETLLRRAALDLTGLPPTIAELDAFLADTSPDAYARKIDALLASPHYGERQARHWLDNARYADSAGYSQDLPRSIWPYRDWVINAFNANMPFDQFTIEQLAGDMIPNATDAQKVATGFHRNTPQNSEGGIDPEQFRIESIMDRVATTATVFLGTTLACSQCHNHKFDPFSQKEYYEFFAFFNNADEPTMTVNAAVPKEQQQSLQDQIKRLDNAIKQKLADWEATLTPEQKKTLPPRARLTLQTPPDRRRPTQVRAINNAFKAVDNDFGAMLTQLDALKGQVGGSTTLIMKERDEPRNTVVFIKGDFTRPGDPVTPGTPRVLPPLESNGEQADRMDLARWIVNPDNPLTARVIVNRIWQQYFGKGLVETENDFGTQGSTPTHPELLDYLATEFIASGWDVKQMHKLIVSSATYQQSSNVRRDLAELDPYNHWLARQSRLRLDAEIVRDVALAASGLLSDKIGGPSVFPPIPDGVMGLGQVKHEWRTSTGEDRFRRGMYTFTFRNTLHPSLATFDAPDGVSACTRRLRSNTPLQALNLLNDTAWVEFARGLAARLFDEMPGSNDRARIRHAFRLSTSRQPTDVEIDLVADLLATARENFAASQPDVKKLVGEETPANVSETDFAAWTLVARAILNLDEAITRE